MPVKLLLFIIFAPGLFLLVQMMFLVPILYNMPTYMSLWIYALPYVEDLDTHIDRHNEAAKILRYIIFQYFLGVIFLLYTVIKYRLFNDFNVQLASANVLVYFLAFVESGIFRGTTFWFMCSISAPAGIAALVLFVSGCKKNCYYYIKIFFNFRYRFIMVGCFGD